MTAQLSLNESLMQFLEQYQLYGFKNKNELICTAFNRLYEQLDRRCCINQKDSLIINYLQFEPILVKLLLINNLAVFMQQRQLDHQKLKQSANFYAEIYETDKETQELTQAALSGWPT